VGRVRIRIVRAKEVTARRRKNGKVYEYKYHILPLTLYLKKSTIKKWGDRFLVEIREDEGTIIIRPFPEVVKKLNSIIS